MNNRTIIAVTALVAIAIIAFLALWRDSTRISDIGSSSAVTGTAAPPSTLPPAGLSHLNETLPARGNLSEQTTQTPVPEVPSRAAPEPAPSMEVPTMPVPGSPIKEKDAPGTPPAEAAMISEKPRRPASSTAGSASASVPLPATVSESANDKVARVQLAARMQGLEPGPSIDLPVRLSQGQSRTIYFFT